MDYKVFRCHSCGKQTEMSWDDFWKGGLKEICPECKEKARQAKEKAHIEWALYEKELFREQGLSEKAKENMRKEMSRNCYWCSYDFERQCACWERR